MIFKLVAILVNLYFTFMCIRTPFCLYNDKNIYIFFFENNYSFRFLIQKASIQLFRVLIVLKSAFLCSFTRFLQKR